MKHNDHSGHTFFTDGSCYSHTSKATLMCDGDKPLGIMKHTHDSPGKRGPKRGDLLICDTAESAVRQLRKQKNDDHIEVRP